MLKIKFRQVRYLCSLINLVYEVTMTYPPWIVLTSQELAKPARALCLPALHQQIALQVPQLAFAKLQPAIRIINLYIARYPMTLQ
jgi:hypothetical protein